MDDDKQFNSAIISLAAGGTAWTLIFTSFLHDAGEIQNVSWFTLVVGTLSVFHIGLFAAYVHYGKSKCHAAISSKDFFAFVSFGIPFFASYGGACYVYAKKIGLTLLFQCSEGTLVNSITKPALFLLCLGLLNLVGITISIKGLLPFSAWGTKCANWLRQRGFWGTFWSLSVMALVAGVVVWVLAGVASTEDQLKSCGYPEREPLPAPSQSNASPRNGSGFEEGALALPAARPLSRDPYQPPVRGRNARHFAAFGWPLQLRPPGGGPAVACLRGRPRTSASLRPLWLGLWLRHRVHDLVIGL